MSSAEGGDRTPRTTEGGAETIRHEEVLEIGTESRELGSVHARKRIDTEHVEELVDRGVEHADVERGGPLENDPGEVVELPDGSLSIPVLEEQLVVTKRVVVRERIIVRKHTVTEQHRVSADLRKERVEIEADPGVTVVDARGVADERGPQR